MLLSDIYLTVKSIFKNPSWSNFNRTNRTSFLITSSHFTIKFYLLIGRDVSLLYFISHEQLRACHMTGPGTSHATWRQLSPANILITYSFFLRYLRIILTHLKRLNRKFNLCVLLSCSWVVYPDVRKTFNVSKMLTSVFHPRIKDENMSLPQWK